jgi:PelA/Pel-15E family pectate lyase
LKYQIVVDGVRGGLVAQHDPITYQPVRGRTYELPSISGAESVGIVKLLMDVDNPTPEIKNAIISAISWFKKNKILGFDYIKNYDLKYNHPVTITYREDPQAKIENTRTFSGRGYDNFLVFNKNSNPLWARFYDLKSQKPFFVGWDGVKKYDISEIDIERRTGYMWYGRWAESLLDHDWPKWKRKYCQNCFAED